MADETKRYPPSQRKLAALWQAGSTPASPALVGAAVIVAAALLGALGGPAMVRWMGTWVQEALRAAARPETAPGVARALAVRGALLAGAVSVLLLAAALIAQVAQCRRAESATAAAPGQRGGASGARVEAWRGGRAVLLIALAAVVVTACVRGGLTDIERVFEVERPVHTIAALTIPIALPLLAVLLAVAVLDALAGRAAWVRSAWMTRREVEEERRDTEGHPLTRERRGVTARRRRHA